VLILLAALHLGGGADSLDRPGISQALAMHRARGVQDVQYDLRLDIRQRDKAVGHVTIRFNRSDSGDVLLDFRGPELHTPPGITTDGAHIRVPASLLVPGQNTLDFDFSANIAPAGASIIRFHDATDGAEYLYTLLVPADANALFPCFDQPDLKAQVTLTLTMPPGWNAVANGAATRTDSTDSAVTTHFAPTERISTYLIAFAAGPWARITSTTTSRPITLYVRASRKAEVEGDSILYHNSRALDWLEHYFDRPFPFQKFDVVLAPSFPFGGMEHPGAIFYNEETFIYRERPTLVQRLGREATIFHEVAHQWFGDLVTMRWFDDLWLKEGFASYMAAVMQDALDPASGAWKTFYVRTRPAAYAVDVTDGTTPIWQTLGNLDQAKSAYGPIVYNKAPAILKQLAFLVGDTAFRDGLRLYLRDHAYGNATWQDLLSSISTASHRPLDAWGRAYILRPGVPIVEQHVGAAAITLVQHPARPLSGPGPWPIKLDVDVDSHAQPVELRADRTTIPGRAHSFVFANAGDYGYAVIVLDSASARWVEHHIGDVHDPLLRAQLWGAMWDLVRDARLPPDRFVAMAARAIPHELDEQIATFVLNRTVRAVTAYRAAPTRLDALLPAMVDDTARAFGIRKASLEAFLGIATSQEAMNRLDGWLDRDSVAGTPLKEPTRWGIVTALVAQGAPTAWDRYHDEQKRDPGTEGKRRAFIAQAASPDSATKHAYFTRYLSDTTLNEEWVTASLRAFNDPEQSTLTRRYLGPALDTLPWIQTHRRIFFLGQWLGAFLDGQTSAEALHEVDRFLSTHPKLPIDLRQKILQSEDELRRTVRIRKSADIERAPAALAPAVG
jgi:aminopeptidase N